jgi:hypothetical protein
LLTPTGQRVAQELKDWDIWFKPNRLPAEDSYALYPIAPKLNLDYSINAIPKINFCFDSHGNVEW